MPSTSSRTSDLQMLFYWLVIVVEHELEFEFDVRPLLGVQVCKVIQ